MSEKVYAGFWIRFVAYIIDAIIVGTVQSFFIVPILGVLGINMLSSMESMQAGGATPEDMIPYMMAALSGIMMAAIISTIISIVYFSFMESSKIQGTVGKMVLGLKVTDMDGNQLNLGKAFLRNIGKILSQMIAMIGFIMAGFTDKKQALHDMIAGALVVKK